MAAIVLTEQPIIVYSEATIADSTGLVCDVRVGFRTQAPDPDVFVYASVGPYTPAQMADPMVGTAALIAARDAAFLAYLPQAYDSSGFPNL